MDHIVPFDELFSACPSFITRGYCDSEAIYGDFDVDLGIRSDVHIVTHQPYRVESDKNDLNGSLYHLQDKHRTYFMLFTDKDSSTDGGIMSDGLCVVVLKGQQYTIGQTIPIDSIVKIMSLYCGHPYLINRSHECWCYSHGECDAPNLPSNNNDLMTQLLEACAELESTVSGKLNLFKEDQSDEESD